MRRAAQAHAFGVRIFLIILALTAGMLVPPSATAEPACADAQDSAPAAVEMAKRCAKRVEITSLRSENSQTFAKPTGGYTTERSVEPRWSHKPDGTWTSIDTNLRLTNGTVSPAASALPVTFSGGGTGPAATLHDGDRELAITWPLGALPKPTLSGSDATYPEVLPGVDLKLTASALGFSELLIVKTREAAKNTKLATVKFGFTTKNVTAATTGAGGVEAKDPQGKVVFSSPTPLMWDSTPASSGSMSVQSTTTPTRPVAMPVSVTSSELSVTPDSAMMTDTATQFPIYIDPSWTGRLWNSGWTLVTNKSNMANTAFWQGGGFLQDAGLKGDAGTGQVCDNPDINGNCGPNPLYNVRSYFQLDMTGVKGKVVTGASMRIQQQWAWTCNNGGSDAVVRVSGNISGATTWNNQPNWWGDGYWASAPANHKYGASNGCLGTGDVEFNVTGMVQHGATDQWDALTVVMHVWNEGTVSQWKRFNSSTALLSIDYNTIPGVPTELTADAKACATGANRPFVPTATPTLRARVSDADGDSLTARFEWARLREDGSYTPVAEARDQVNVGSGTVGQVTLPSGVLDHSETIVGTGKWDNFDTYPDVIARDSGGYLYLFRGDGTKLGNRVLIGTGWNGVTVAGIADWDGDGKRDIIARIDSTGELYVYPGDGTAAPSTQQQALIGTGFGTYTFAGVADVDKDGKADVVAMDSAGTVWLYPGENKRSPSSQARAQIGSGFGAYTFHGVIDRTGDGAPDIVAEYGGTLWLYLGSGTRAPYSGTPYRYDIGTGWTGVVGQMTPDFNGDGAPDMVAQLPGQSNWLLYPGVVGTGYGGNASTVASVGLTEGSYAYRATAKDWQVWGPTSGWCEFTVDITAPAAPTVQSTVYKPTGCAPEGCGSLGVADTFTFTSADAVKYRWGFTDPPSMTVPAGTPVRWTPPSTGPKTLYVDAVDRAGLSARTTYQFTVAGPTLPVGKWLLGDDPTVDMSGSGHNLTPVGAISTLPGRTVGGESAYGFDGAANAATSKVLDTSRSFSVSAWVRLTGDTVSRTAVSQQGAVTSAFKLGYDAAQHKWVFSLGETDATNAVQQSAVSDAAAAPSVWTHLTGTYESANREVRLYVDGALQQAIGVMTTGFDASGGLWVGKRLYNSAAVEPWLGDLTDVRVWSRAITHQEEAELVDPNLVSGVGEWKLDEPNGTTAFDTSPYGHDLTLTLAPGASWGQGKVNGGLHLDGTGSANSAEPVVNTDQTFSVDVWARLAETGAQRTIVVQRGPSGVDPFALKYDGAKWTVEMPNSPASPTTWWRVSSVSDSVINTWTHLTAVYDAATRTLRLWVDDQLQGTASGVVGWNSTGMLSVGRGSAGAYWFGDIDELKVFQGALSAKPLTTTAPVASSVSGDARSEIISVDVDGTVRAFLNVNGAYPNPAQSIGSGWTPARTWFADIDADGKTEIITLDPDGTIRAFQNINGMNGFPFGGAVLIGKATSTDPSRLRFADIDGDGRADRVSLDADGRVRVYRNLFGLNKQGQLTAFASSPVVVKVTTAVADAIRFADIDGDHKAELITINDDQTVSAYRNLSGLGYGTYDTAQEIGSGWTPDRTRFGDINGDGRAEIISVRADGTVWSYPNLNGFNGFPYGDGVQIGSGWSDPARVFFG